MCNPITFVSVTIEGHCQLLQGCSRLRVPGQPQLLLPCGIEARNAANVICYTFRRKQHRSKQQRLKPLHRHTGSRRPSRSQTTSAVANMGGGEALIVDTLGRVIRPAYQQRVTLHEAGHFLIAYLVGLLPRDYTMSSLDAFLRYRALNVQAGCHFCDGGFEGGACC
uniref:Peptidase M41 domain-containing protein n=1 Tax=Tetradesmus obliquus TaxID=3088 RepID=A0A383VIU2_TETOB|eukprot:jgi/Sobl393_1/18263/SZX65121.1